MRKKIFILCSVLMIAFFAGAQKCTVLISEYEQPFVWTGEGVTVVETSVGSSFEITKSEGGSIISSEGKMETEIDGLLTAADNLKPGDIKAWFDSDSERICFTLGDNLDGLYIARLYDTAGRLVSVAPVGGSFTNIASGGAGTYILTVMGRDGSFVCSCKIIAR